MLNNKDFVTILRGIERRIEGSGLTFDSDLQQRYLQVMSNMGATANFKIVRLHRPSSTDVKDQASPNILLVITGASKKASEAAANVNHIIIPEGSLRIIAPGVALISEPASDASLHETKATQVKLRGQTGVVVETLLVEGKRNWSVNGLAAKSSVSTALVVRIVKRLEQEGIMTVFESGPKKTRALTNPRALAELWSQEEAKPLYRMRGFVYGSSNEAIAQSLLKFCSNGAIGGVFAANLYKPVLTKVVPPIRFWLPDFFAEDELTKRGFEITDEGANVELVKLKNDPWLVHVNDDGTRRVSPWRAWLEISHATGRTKELADTLLKDLEERWNGSN